MILRPFAASAKVQHQLEVWKSLSGVEIAMALPKPSLAQMLFAMQWFAHLLGRPASSAPAMPRLAGWGNY
jgi:hypothetical protein